MYFKHESAFVDEPCEIGEGTKIWHFCHVQKGARIGRNCVFGQNCNVANDVVIGNNVKVQNNVSIYTGTVIEDDVFLGPSCVLTNVTNPRSQVNRHSLYEKTLLRRGCSIGANATIVCGVTVVGTDPSTIVENAARMCSRPRPPRFEDAGGEGVPSRRIAETLLGACGGPSQEGEGNA